MDIHSVKSSTFLASENVNKCSTTDSRVKPFLDFKKLNESLFIYCDKSPNIAYITETDYKSKLNDLFDNQHFSKIENFRIEKELVAFRKLLRETIGTNISNISLIKLFPLNTIAHCYGSLKTHKPGLPLRPITTGFSSLTAPVETYLANIFEPLLTNCSFLVKSTQEFKEKFLAEKNNFNSQTDEIITLDIKSLYTSVNIPKVTDYIVDLIYRDPRQYFPSEYDGVGNLLPIPDREKFVELILGTLSEFNIFKTKVGIFKQHKGLPMGGYLSPIVSNLFVNMLEDEIVKRFQRLGHIKIWRRFADDIVTVISKGSLDRILSKLNSWDSEIVFTSNKMTNNSLIFLDCNLFLENNEIHFRHYRKFGLDTVLSNFKHSKMSKKYLKANIFTQCHNLLNGCSSFEIFLSCLEDLKTLLYQNDYPKYLVKERIDIFLQNQEKPELPNIDAILCLQYTSPQAEYFARKLIQKMKFILPTFHVSLALKTCKITQLFSTSAKAPPESVIETANTNYQFVCVCKSDYIGHCKRPLDHRIKEHSRHSNDGNEVFDHITLCPDYKSKLRQILRDKKSSTLKPHQVYTLKMDFFRSKFKIIAKRFKRYYDRLDSEAYYIRKLKPVLNCQMNHKVTFFSLWNGTRYSQTNFCFQQTIKNSKTRIF